MPLEILPDVTQVAAILHARTRSNETGEEVGTFDATTRPTATQVADYTDQAVIEVEMRLPVNELDARLTSYATRLVALRAAMFIEIGLEPDRTTDSDSAYARLKELYDGGMQILMDALEDQGDGGATFRFADIPITTPVAVSSGLILGDDLLV
jgi:hypothetical protein